MPNAHAQALVNDSDQTRASISKYLFASSRETTLPKCLELKAILTEAKLNSMGMLAASSSILTPHKPTEYFDLMPWQGLVKYNAKEATKYYCKQRRNSGASPNASANSFCKARCDIAPEVSLKVARPNVVDVTPAPKLLREHKENPYSMHKLVGRGSYGTVHLCTLRDDMTLKPYACKTVAKRNISWRSFLLEVIILDQLSHSPNIVKIKEAFQDDASFHLITEFCEGGTLFDRIVRHGPLSEGQSAGVMRSILGGIHMCHLQGVLHRDLKLENIMFTSKNNDAQLKIIDFGLSTFFAPGDVFTEQVGTRRYMAPEVLNRCYGPKADIWSAGVILCLLLDGTLLFSGSTELDVFKDIGVGDIDFKSGNWPKISCCAKDLVSKMLNKDPAKRLAASEALSHPWLLD